MSDKFFKLKIQKILDRLPIPITFNDAQWAMVYGLEENRFWVQIAARRTGKSYAASIIAFAKLLEPGQQVMVVAPNFSLSSIIWDYVTDLIKNLGIEVDKFNQKDKVVRLINGSVFRLLSANNRDSLIGRGANLLIVDEAAVIPNDEYFVRDLRPALSTFKNSRCLWISTPRGKGNYLYNYFLRGGDSEFPEWGSNLFTWEANPLLSVNDVEEARKAMSRAMFAQEYECEWTTTEDQVYDALNEETHIGEFIGERFIEVIAGLLQRISVSLTTLTSVDLFAPNITTTCLFHFDLITPRGTRFLPIILTSVPPLVSPQSGLTASTMGQSNDKCFICSISLL